MIAVPVAWTVTTADREHSDAQPATTLVTPLPPSADERAVEANLVSAAGRRVTPGTMRLAASKAVPSGAYKLWAYTSDIGSEVSLETPPGVLAASGVIADCPERGGTFTICGGSTRTDGHPLVVIGRLPVGATTVQAVYGDGHRVSATTGAGLWFALLDGVRAGKQTTPSKFIAVSPGGQERASLPGAQLQTDVNDAFKLIASTG